MLSNDELLRLVRDISKELQLIPVEALRSDFFTVTAKSKEEHSTAEAAPATTGDGTPSKPAGSAKTQHLDQYTVNLTTNAKAGKIDPVLGRDQEIRQVVDILMRRRQNNPILTGEAGVGKTAVVEGVALRVSQRDLPPALKMFKCIVSISLCCKPVLE